MLRKPRAKHKILLAGLCCSVLVVNLPPAYADIEAKSEKLQGNVEVTNDGLGNIKPSLGSMDYGKPANNYIQGSVQQEDVETSKENPVAAGEDPDAQDKELMVEWDHWRNRFLQAVLSGTTEVLNNDQAQNYQFNAQRNIVELKYPMGTTTWFSCQITKDRQIKNIQIEHPSGFIPYDQAVREAVQALSGSSILTFPSRSKRLSVLQAGGVQRTPQVSKQYFHFNDTERYRVPSY